MILSITLLVITILVIITILYKQLKWKKNIWQKISFLYNQLYNILIIWYYNKQSKKIALKEEIQDYYKDIVKKNNLKEKNKNGQEVKWFLLKYYSDYENNIIYIYEAINMYYNKYYTSLQKTIIILSYILVFIVFLLIILILKK